MSQFGMGATYTHSESGMLIKALSSEKREKLLQKYYDPYHASLERKTEELLQVHGKCIII